MYKISEEKINLNFVRFVKILQKYKLYTDKLAAEDQFNNLLKLAPSHTKDETGGAYNGGLIEHILLVTDYAKKINENLLKEDERIENESLMKVCFLHQISKAKEYRVNDVEWEIKKGNFYKFNDGLPALKTGEYSAYLCSEYGIELTEDEYEAILSIDKEDDVQTKLFGNMLSRILRVANEFANVERKKNFIKK